LDIATFSFSSPSIQANINNIGKYWEEEIPPTNSLDVEDFPPEKKLPPRQIFYSRKLETERRLQQYKEYCEQFQPKMPKKTLTKKSHKLRTNLWNLTLTSRNRRIFSNNRTFVIDFHEDGYCWNSNDYSVGRWQTIPSGISWNFSPSQNLTLRFTSEVHLNPFGEHPRMLRGVVVRDRIPSSWSSSNWFRPVVGTFEAVGISSTDLCNATKSIL